MRPTVLIADVDSELCSLLPTISHRASYRVETATDRLDCLEKLQQRGPSVLILDLELRWDGEH
jgi:DNA-binding response OmpR family regulator